MIASRTTAIETSDSRRFTLREPDCGEQFDLIELAGGRNATNQMWMLRAAVVYSFQSEGDVPIPKPGTIDQLKANARQIGDEAISLGYRWMFPVDGDGEAAAGAAKVDVAKN